MNTSQSSQDGSDDEYDLQTTYNKLYKECIKLIKINKISRKRLNDLEHEKESLVTKLCESHALVESLKSEITMLVENNQSPENELKASKELSHRLSSDNLKNLFCVQKHVSNKPSLIVENLVASTSHTSNFNFRKTVC
jgi:hypothetical protein